MDCARCHGLIPRVIDEEAASADVHAAEAHLALCEACAHRASVERSLAELDHEDAATTAKLASSAWRRGLVLAVTASSLIALGALAPALLSSEPAAPVGAVTSPAQRSGTLTCSDCEAARRRRLPGLESALPRPDKAAPHGRLHLRDDSGEYWELLPQGDDSASLADHALAGRRATVFGILEPDLHAIRVARLRLD